MGKLIHNISDYFLRIALVLLSGGFGRNHEAEAKPKRILLFRNCFLGDFIVCIPTLYALRISNPQAQILFINFGTTRKRTISSLRTSGVYELANELVDEFQDFNLAWRSIWSARSTVREFGPNCVVILRYSRERYIPLIKKVALLRLIGVTCTIETGLFSTSPETAGPVNQVVTAWQSTKNLIAGTVQLDPEYPLVRRDLYPPEWMDGNKWLALSPGTKELNFNLWPAEKFRELVNCIAHTFPGHKLVLLGSENDFAIAEYIAKDIPTNAYRNLCGSLSIPESFSILRGCELAITLDSGPMHLAAAAGCTLISIFSSYQPIEYWLPWTLAKTVIRREIECENCLEHSGYCIRGDYACIREISVSSVFSDVQRVLKKHTN